jgi:hypothetical protein
MSVLPPAGKTYRFNPPPNWPTPPPGWTPPQGWAPPPSWPPPPHGWQWWVEALPAFHPREDTWAAGPTLSQPGDVVNGSQGMLRQEFYPGQPYEPSHPQGQPRGQQALPPAEHNGRPAQHREQPARESWQRRHKVLTVLGSSIALLIIGAIILMSSLTPGPSNSYADVQSLLYAMAAHGATCSNVTMDTGGSVSGELNPYADCSGTSAGDTAVLVFKDHASAMAYAHSMLSTGQSLGNPTAEVVGPDWVVNTKPAFADMVVTAVGGQLMAAG